MKYKPLSDFVEILDSKRVPLSSSQRQERDSIYNYYGATGIIDKVDDYLFDGEHLLIGEDGADFINKRKKVAFIVNERFWANNHVHVLRVKETASIKFLEYVVNMVDFSKIITGTAQKKLNQKRLKEIQVPDIPLDEQIRIAERLEEAERQSLSIQSESDRLLQDISDFRQEILTRAFRGDLTEQNFDEGTGMELLTSIQLERQTHQTKGKKKTELAPVSKEEEPYELPPNWTWTRLGEVINSSNRNQNIEDGLEVSFVPMTVVSDGFKNEINPEIKKWSEIKKGYTHLKDGDVVFAKITPCFQNRKSAIIQGLKNGIGAGSTELVVLKSVGDFVNPKMFFYLTLSKEFIDGGVNTYQGTAGQQRVSMDWLRNYPFPLPPLAEQERIVAKIEAILSALDVMEDAITKQKEEAKACYEEILRKEMGKAEAKTAGTGEKELETTNEEMAEVRVG